MINLVARRIRPDHRDRVAAWLREVNGPRRAEALESLAAEGVTHETALLIETADGPVIIYAMETDDLAHSQAVADRSTRSIDAEHRAIMRAADGGAVDAEIALDLRRLSDDSDSVVRATDPVIAFRVFALLGRWGHLDGGGISASGCVVRRSGICI